MSLCVTSLRLSHFRSHGHSQLATDGRPVALYGANGAGKTNLLEAVSLLSPGRGLRRAGAADMMRRPDAVGWKISAQITTQGQAHEVETWSDQGAARQLRLNGKSATQIALGQLTRVLWLVPAMDRLWTEGAEGRRRFLDRAALSFEPAHAEAVLTYEKAMRERNRLLRDGQRDGHWYGALERQMAEAGWRIYQTRARTVSALMAAQQGAQTAFPAADLTLAEPEGDAPHSAEDLRDALAASRPRDLQAGRSLTGPHRSDLLATWAAKGIAARDCSTGEQKALLVSLILANARALDSAPLVLLDEVAAHLDADRRSALFDEICALGVQAWMTGTGPELFDSLGPRAQYFDICEAASGSTAQPEARP